jgi:hypothetical protein
MEAAMFNAKFGEDEDLPRYEEEPETGGEAPEVEEEEEVVVAEEPDGTVEVTEVDVIRVGRSAAPARAGKAKPKAKKKAKAAKKRPKRKAAPKKKKAPARRKKAKAKKPAKKKGRGRKR